MNEMIITTFCFFLIATVYSAVGHGGASGYLATMSLLAFSPHEMKPAALALNVLVASITSLRFYRAGYFSWRLFWPFAAASIPLSFLGGGLTVNSFLYEALVGLALLFAAIHLMIRFRGAAGQAAVVVAPNIPVSIAAGGVIGFLSGLAGVGGGIFLSPVLVIGKWARLRETAAVAAVFILVNSVAGLSGHLQQGGNLPGGFPAWAVAVVAGGYIGSSLGTTRFNNPVLRLLLGTVLLFAGIKMVVP